MNLAIPNREVLRELVRFYQAAIVNTAFGISLYFVLVRIGLNLYVAQAAAHVLGMTFNYYTYSRHVFRDSAAAKSRFFYSYVIYYFISAGFLFAAHQVLKSPYVSGLVATFLTSVINYFSLKYLVFKKRAK